MPFTYVVGYNDEMFVSFAHSSFCNFYFLLIFNLLILFLAQNSLTLFSITILFISINALLIY